MEEIKRIAVEMGVPIIMFPDTSEVLNGPLTGKFGMFPAGGVTVAEWIQDGSSLVTVALGRWPPHRPPSRSTPSARCPAKS